MNIREACDALVLGARDYFRKNNFSKAIVGLSGGLDSSVAISIVAKALGKGNVTAILMPDIGTTSPNSMRLAKELLKKLQVRHFEIPINDFVRFFKGLSKKMNYKDEIYAISNVKARTRMMMLYFFANLENALVVGTSDKSEIALGYTTKYGDNAADILVIGDLWKTEVIELGRFLGISAEKELGAPYNILDRILRKYIEEGLSPQQIIADGFDRKLVNDIIERVRINEHKRRTAMILRVSGRSFHGMEWRMPITNRFN